MRLETVGESFCAARGRIYIYASLGRYTKDDEADIMAQYGIGDVSCDELARGVIIGSVELYDFDEGDWHEKEPERAITLRKPANQPQPVWFKPF